MSDDLHWLDRVIAEQRAVQGDAVTRLIADAARAQECIPIEELDGADCDEYRVACMACGLEYDQFYTSGILWPPRCCGACGSPFIIREPRT